MDISSPLEIYTSKHIKKVHHKDQDFDLVFGLSKVMSDQLIAYAQHIGLFTICRERL